MATATPKLGAAPRKIIPTPAAIAESPTIARVPYREAIIPDTKEATIIKMDSAVMRLPTWE